MGTSTERSKLVLKTSQFDGSSDVECFIRRFGEISAANKWNDSATVLHLKEVLREGVQEYGSANTIPDIFDTLGAWYGTSLQEASSTHLERSLQTAFKSTPQRSGSW